MKLYHYPASTFARRVRVALLEKNIPCELIELNLPARQHQEDWYAALNPPRCYLVGESFTLADVAYLPFLHFLGLMEVSAGPSVKAWAERILARPSAQATVPAR